MSDALDRGITVTEMAAMDEPVDVQLYSAAAFVGRALRGPLNTPVLVRSLSDFNKAFGGVWPKSSMGPAVQQFFEHGGQRLYVVRVANGAKSATLQLPTDGDPLRLSAVNPGSTETLRLSVDYDGLAADDTEHFNLTVQRLAPDGSLLVDQEIHNRLSCVEGSDRYVVNRLRDSSLVQLQGPVPGSRPRATIGPQVQRGVEYVQPTERGDDGDELSDYDLVGSATEKTGIFALDAMESFDLLYLPPTGRGRDIGLAATMAADLYCRRRGAMLIVDPPLEWSNVEAAIRGVSRLGLASPNMLSYFPRVIDREEPVSTSRAAGGALAGLICRFDDRTGPWCDPERVLFALRPRYQPAVAVDGKSAEELVHEGLNVLAALKNSRVILHGGVTLARQSPCQKQFTSLSVRRLALYIGNSVGRATRWAVFQPESERLAERLRRQVQAFLAGLHDEGAFENDRFDVQCHLMSPVDENAAVRRVTIVIGFLPAGQTDTLWLTLHQDIHGFRASTAAFAPSLDPAGS